MTVRQQSFFVALWTVIGLSLFPKLIEGFVTPRAGSVKRNVESLVVVSATKTRREVLQRVVGSIVPTVVVTALGQVDKAEAKDQNFTPGGTLVDRPVGVTVGNSEATTSRKLDNSNALFQQDHYFKFGVAPEWIEPGNIDFPKTMPFTLTQQRYDTLKKYGNRLQSGFASLQSINDSLQKDDDDAIVNQVTTMIKEDAFNFRPMGLVANGFLASENTGTTNELLLSRWYINEMYLQVNDIATDESSKRQGHYQAAIKAANSYIQLMNRVITPKVGEKLPFL